MKPVTFTLHRLALGVTVICLLFGLTSWDFKQFPGTPGQANLDTLPKKTEKKIRDLDEALEELNSDSWKLEMEKGLKEMKEALKSFDKDKMKLEIEKALQEVDVARIRKEVQESLAQVDFTKMKEELASALKNLDLSKMKKELSESLARIDFDKMKSEIEKIKAPEMKRLEEEMKKLGKELEGLGPKIEKQMEKARVEIEKAGAELTEYRDFVNGLADEGLLDKSNYSLKHKNGELFINGNKASEQTYTKYRSFLEKHKSFKINKDKEDFVIDKD